MSIFHIDPDVGMMRVPHSSHFQQHEGGGYLSVVNSFGIREDEVPVERVDGRPRLVVLGDSFTFGTGVEVADRYTQHLERLLPEWDILNFGLTGSGVDQQLLLWRKFASGIHHDAVLLAPWAENIRRNSAKFRLWNDQWVGAGDRVVWMPKPYFVLGDDGSLTLEHVPCPDPEPFTAVDAADADQPRFNWLRLQVRKLGPGVKERLQRLTHVQPVPEYNSADGYEWRLQCAIIEEFAAEIERPVMFAPIPMYQHIEGAANSNDYQARLREFAESSAVDVFDALPALRSYDDPRSMRFVRDMHFAPHGHRAFAEVLAPELRRWLDA